ncbi:MAG: D-alanyl-D-alanine endopeptidase [Burkholderiales bacterium]|nr:D-alanyl-D-alanine endopeptidase [Burkholderiales bacterium]
MTTLLNAVRLFVASVCTLTVMAGGALADSTQGSLRQVNLGIKSGLALVVDQDTGEVLYSKNTQEVAPIASITKLMTAIVIIDSGLPLLEPITVQRADVDRYKGSRSKLVVGTALMRAEALKLALMASENRAAAALARTYPGGAKAFVDAMNAKAFELGMLNTRFVDATGLRPENVSTARDLALLVAAAHSYPLIRDYTTAPSFAIESRSKRGHRILRFVNSNRLVRSSRWDIGLSKTGYISEAGRCLVMQSRIAERSLIIVLLDSWGKLTRIGDANRIRRWLEREFSALSVRG